MTEQAEAISSAEMVQAKAVANGAASMDAAGKSSNEGGNFAKNSEAPASGAQIAQAVKNLNAGFGEVVGLLMRDPKLRHLSLADLEWLVLPALAANQMMTLRGKVKDKDGLSLPLALALWAKVSEDVDQKLEAQKAAGAPLRLAPADWISGDIPWLVLSVGPKELQAKLQEKLRGDSDAEIKVFAD